MTDENEITNIVTPNDEVVEPNENLEINIVEPNTKVVETKVTKSRDEFINLDNLRIFPDEIKIFPD